MSEDIEKIEEFITNLKDNIDDISDTLDEISEEYSELKSKQEDFEDKEIKYNTLQEIIKQAEDADYGIKSWRRLETKQDLIEAIKKEVL